jgi:hypothetical protein
MGIRNYFKIQIKAFVNSLRFAETFYKPPKKKLLFLVCLH